MGEVFRPSRFIDRIFAFSLCSNKEFMTASSSSGDTEHVEYTSSPDDFVQSKAVFNNCLCTPANLLIALGFHIWIVFSDFLIAPVAEHGASINTLSISIENFLPCIKVIIEFLTPHICML